jgi:hypothetical protein
MIPTVNRYAGKATPRMNHSIFLRPFEKQADPLPDGRGSELFLLAQLIIKPEYLRFRNART